MNEIRKKRLESQIVREISQMILKRRVKDDRLGFVSVTRADLFPDLSRLTIFVSLFGDKADATRTWKGLLAAARPFQSEVSRNLRLRATPKLTFEIDDTIQEGDRILGIIESGSGTPEG